MFAKKLFEDLNKLHRRLNGSTIEYDLTFYKNFLNEINEYLLLIKEKSDREIKDLSRQLINKAARSFDADELLIESYAIVTEAIQRILKIKPFASQIIGGIAMHFGKMIEMQTGEGKTLTAVFPAYLNALSGKGVHILTFNDYLAKRDAGWMGPVYNFLGLKTGYVQEGMDIKSRQEAYRADITYLTAKEAGFDYLRDNLRYNLQDIVHRPFNFALVDEADSIMIDEARIPLIIAGSSNDAIHDPVRMSGISKAFKENIDFEIDENARNIYLTEEGIKKSERLLGCKNLFEEKNYETLTMLNCALHAEYLLRRNIDYIIRRGKIELVDEFTGRVADKRRWPDGLQAAVEAKENVPVQAKGSILNSITLQNFIRLYPRICGMTATASEAELEFKRFFNLDVVIIPPEKSCVRKDYPDIIFKTKESKYRRIISEIIKARDSSIPVLIGTVSVSESETLSQLLQKAGLRHKVLNAKNDELEAGIIAEAGMPGAITISTNMAGRGTDIKLGGGDEKLKEKIVNLGGLYIIGTNRHESRRIDNQLRGRAGRQGDPGSSRFFISTEDDLFVKYNLNKLLPLNFILNEKSDETDNTVLIKEIARVQRIIEGQNLEIRKNLNEYSAITEQQREIIYKKRNDILHNNQIYETYKSKHPQHFGKLTEKFADFNLEEIFRKISLLQIDNQWSNFLADTADIKEAIHLQRLGGQDPVFIFRKNSVEMFDKILDELEKGIIESLNKIVIKNGRFNPEDTGLNAPSSTWTYLINDNPFENMLGIGLIGNINAQIGAGVFGFLFAIFEFYKKYKSKRKK